MKKVLSMILVLILILSVVPLGAFEFSVGAETQGYFTYIVEDGEATITDVDTSISGDIIIPDTLGGYSTTRIDDDAFYACNSLTNIIIPSSVTYIGICAFYRCSELTSITLPNSITNLGAGAFMECVSLENVTIGNGITSIRVSTFALCSNLTSITMPSSVTNIEDGAFNLCTKLNDVWYAGHEEDRANIGIGSLNYKLTDSNWHYNSCIGTDVHTYDNNCDKKCNICNKKREVNHIYDNTDDNVCNVCGALNSVGNVNDDNVINNKDLGLLIKYINGWQVDVTIKTADVNADDVVNNKDYALLIRYINGWPVELK